MGVLRSLKRLHCAGARIQAARRRRRWLPRRSRLARRRHRPHRSARPLLSCVKVSKRPAENRLRPPMVAIQTSSVLLSSATYSTARWASPSAGVIDLPLAVLVKRQAVLGARPDAVAIHADIEHVVVGQPVRGGEVLPPEARHVAARAAPRAAANRAIATVASAFS